MQYQFFCPSDKELIDFSELPLENILCLAMRTTGYKTDTDEIVELALCDAQGKILFSTRAKPQNIETWSDTQASGGLLPDDVKNECELFQFEDEIRSYFDAAEKIVALHPKFSQELLGASWITLPKYEAFDLLEYFCKTHASSAFASEAATVATLNDMLTYFSAYAEELASEEQASSLLTCEREAKAIAFCYRSLIAECMHERKAKGNAYWEAYEARLREEAKADEATREKNRREALKTTRINALLWLCAAAVFSNLGVQMLVRGFDTGVVIMIIALALFFVYKWIRQLVNMYKLSKH